MPGGFGRFGALALLAAAGCGEGTAAPAPPAAPTADVAPEPPALPLKDLGGFEYQDKMELPGHVLEWNGKRVRATGFINPGREVKNLTKFLLVKDRQSCCFGRLPQLNHYVDVTLKEGQSAHYTTDPVTVEGVLVVDDRWDGDWPLGLYWMKDAELIP